MNPLPKNDSHASPLSPAPTVPQRHLRAVSTFEKEDLSNYAPASTWSRFAALSIDGVLISIISKATGLAIGLTSSIVAIGALPTAIAELAIAIAYPIYFLINKNGQTPGKKWLKIRVIKTDREDGSFQSWGEVFKREYWGRILAVITVIGYPLAFFNEKKLGLHDMVGKTRVIKYN